MSSRRPVPIESHLPLLAFVLFTSVAGLLQALVAPALLAINTPDLGAARTVAEQARLASAAFGWAAIAIVTVASLIGAMVYSGWVVWASSGAGRVRATAIWAITILVIAGLSVAADLSGSTPAFWTSLLEPPHFKWPLTRATLIGNALGLASVGGLFVAAGTLIRAYRTTDIPQTVAIERLRWLLILGAVATVCGVIEIRSIHRLPGAAIAAADMRGNRVADTRSLHAALLQEITSASTPDGYEAAAAKGKLPILAAVIDATYGSSIPPETKPLMRHYFTVESQAGEPARSADDMVELLMQSRDEAARAALVTQMDDVALHIASFTGALFSVGLTLLYLPAAAILTSPRATTKDADASRQVPGDKKLGLLSNTPMPATSSQPDPQQARVQAGERPTDAVPPAPAPLVRPFSDQILALTKVLTALAPLLAGLVGELLKSILTVSG